MLLVLIFSCAAFLCQNFFYMVEYYSYLPKDIKIGNPGKIKILVAVKKRSPDRPQRDRLKICLDPDLKQTIPDPDSQLKLTVRSQKQTILKIICYVQQKLRLKINCCKLMLLWCQDSAQIHCGRFVLLLLENKAGRRRGIQKFRIVYDWVFPLSRTEKRRKITDSDLGMASRFC